MNITFYLYMAEVVENLKGYCTVTIGISVIATLLILFATAVTNDGYNEDARKANDFLMNLLTKIYSKVWFFILICLINIFTPSKHTMYLMAGTYYLQSSTLPTKVSEVLNLKLDDVIKELKDKK